MGDTKVNAGTRKYKVKFANSLRFKIILLLVVGMLCLSIIELLVTLPMMRSNMQDVTLNYILDEVKAYGKLLETSVNYSGDGILDNTSTLSGLIGDVNIKGMDSSYAYLVKNDGTILYHPATEKIGQPVENEVVKGIVAELANYKIPEPASIRYTYKGANKYAGYYVNQGGKFILVVTVDEKDAFRAIDKMSISMVGASIIALLILVVIGILVSNGLVIPLEKLTGIVNKVADLDFTKNEQQKKLDARKDEIGLISRAISNLHEQLRIIIENIQEQSVQLAGSNEAFEVQFREIVEGINNVNTAVEEIAMGSTSQANETSSAGEQVSDIGEAIESNSGAVSMLEQSIQQMNTLAKQSKSMLEELVKINKQTAENMDVVKAQTDTTNLSSEKIKEAVHYIQDIASETNLLSLNASIEAARAGESGRGFAVVAEEIRKLAENSALRASEIDAIAMELMGNAKESVVMMDELTADTATQFEKLTETQQSFANLENEINTVSDASADIFQQTDRISQLKSGVSSVIEQLSAIAQQNAASTQETSATMNTLTNNIDKCKSETETLAMLSSDLNEQAGKFKF